MWILFFKRRKQEAKVINLCNNVVSNTTVEPLLKDTSEIRTPESLIRTFSEVPINQPLKQGHISKSGHIAWLSSVYN